MLSAAPAGLSNSPREGNAAQHTLRLDIQGLRALAVSLVVFSHAGVSLLSGGYVGVDVFFVISGFLITSLLLREISASDGISIRKFYARRALRLLPASTLVIVTTLGGAWLFLSKIRFTEYAGDALSSALYAVNFRLAINGTDYLAQGSPPSPFQHFWSLAVEEQFYLVWPVLLLLSWKVARRRGFLAAPLVVLCLVSFGLSVSTTQTSAPWAYFGSQTRIWELGVGSLLALSVARLERLSPRIAAPMTWIGLLCIVLSALVFGPNTPFPGYDAVLPVVGAGLVLAGGCAPAPLGAGLLLARRPAVWLGGLSYGWYLWHWPLLIIGPMALKMPNSLPLALLLSAAALPLAWVTLRLVENPVRFHKAFRNRLDRPGRALWLGLALSAGAASIALVAAAFPPSVNTGGSAAGLKATLTAAPDPQARLTELLKTSPTRLPRNLTPSLDKIKAIKSAVYQDGCHLNYVSTQTPPCVYGDTSSKKTVVLFGDSHAAQWFPAMNRLALERGWKLVSLTKASCKTAAVTIIRNGNPYTSCDTWRNKAIAKINGLHPALVIVSSSEAGTPAQPMKNSLQGWTDGFRNTFQRLGTSGTRVAALLDTPWPKVDAVDCAAAHPLKLKSCANQASKAIQDASRRTATRNAATLAHASVIDPVPWLCSPAGNCPVVVGNTVAYRDNSHMAESYAEAIAPVLGQRLSALFGTDLTH
ncbi:acyltransferase family protein [Actinacidiphila soli]|uniref:acyltransferase family protein n=1 Tax=Actinacidiphila soli TaxID=2487275 RepID=UPI000FCCD8BE|nr:acyltransferase family protein [Actinacidiphila soli]